jgi:hypothetical protein
MGEYLNAFAERYLDRQIIRLGCRVTKTSWSKSKEKWTVHWDANGDDGSQSFDYLIIASGFFNEPYTPAIPGLDQFQGTVVHSSEYTSAEIFKDKQVAIIGGSLSSVEVAEDIALHAASIHHVIPRPFWVLPRYLPLTPGDPGTTFLPLDVKFYGNSEPKQEIKSLQERWRQSNTMIRNFAGDQSQISEILKIDPGAPPCITISDMYGNYVRSGKISLHLGHLTSFEDSQLQVAHESVTKVLPPEITHVVFATGFRPTSAPSFLPKQVLDALEYFPKDNFIPFLLHLEMFHPTLPNAVFVGYYRGPYFGIIELQARYAAAVFSGNVPWPEISEMKNSITKARTLRSMQPRMQFPRGLYVDFGREIAKAMECPLATTDVLKEAGKEHHDGTAYDVFGPHLFYPPRWYLNRDYVHQEALFDSLQRNMEDAEFSALFVAQAVFRCLHGSWDLNRVYTSRLPEYPSGPSIGTADFNPRKASQGLAGDTDRVIYPVEYLYAEKTELTTSSGMKFAGTQHYLYRYDEKQDEIEVYFTKRDDAFTLDYLFHYIRFRPESEEEQVSKVPGKPWTIKARHPCGQDVYDVAYTFFFNGIDVEKWKIEYEVKGPRKDYKMETWYTRPQKQGKGESKI